MNKIKNAFYYLSDSLYQQWNGYPQSPILTSSYPYQIIGIRDGTITRLWVSDKPIWSDGSSIPTEQKNFWTDSTNTKRYDLQNGLWVLTYTGSNVYWGTYLQSNCDVYADSAYTTILFYKSTDTLFQKKRVRSIKILTDEKYSHNLKHKNSDGNWGGVTL